MIARSINDQPLPVPNVLCPWSIVENLCHQGFIFIFIYLSLYTHFFFFFLLLFTGDRLLPHTEYSFQSQRNVLFIIFFTSFTPSTTVYFSLFITVSHVSSLVNGPFLFWVPASGVGVIYKKGMIRYDK